MNNEKLKDKIDDIRALMYKGRRSVIISSKSLFVWSITALLATEISPLILSKFGNYINYFFLLIFYIIVFGTAIIAQRKFDVQVTKELGEILDYTVFLLTKVWITTVGLGVLFTIFISLHGGIEYVYAVWLLFVGIGIYFSGFFSMVIFEKYGLILICIGLASFLIPKDQAMLVGQRIVELFVCGGLIVLGIYVKKKYKW